MKRAGNLWGKFISDENLTQAVYNATTFKKNNIAVRRKLGYFTDEEIKNKPEDVPLNSLSNIKVSNMVLELRNMLTSSDW